jgi:predicted metalloprotease
MKTRTSSLLLIVSSLFAAGCTSTTSGVSARSATKIGTPSAQSTPDTNPDGSPVDSVPSDTTLPDTPAAPGTTEAATQDTSAPGTVPEPTADTLPGVAPVFDFGTGKKPQAYDKVLQAEVDDVQSFWTNEFPKIFSKAYTPLTGKVFAGFPGRTDIPGCGSRRSVYEQDLKDNAFYCGRGDFVAYDDADLFPKLSENLGDLSLGVVLAHEWGHAIQARADVPNNTPTVKLEQQADCYAGAWSAHLARGENPNLPFSDAELKNAMLALLAVKDPVGADPAAPGAHGSGFDRVGAYQDGFINGTKQCSTYIDNPPPLLELTKDPGFDTNNGNAPLDDPDSPAFGDPNDASKVAGIFGLLVDPNVPNSLPTFWIEQLKAGGVTFTPPKLAGYNNEGPFPTCSTTDTFAKKPYVYCPDDNTLYFNRTAGKKVYDAFGDYAIGYLLSNGYGDAVQTALGSKLKGAKRALLNDCLTGAFTAGSLPDSTDKRPQRVSIQAGDLDEAVQTAVIIGDTKSTDDQVGTGFQKVAAFRSGVLGGLTACNKQIAGS